MNATLRMQANNLICVFCGEHEVHDIILLQDAYLMVALIIQELPCCLTRLTRFYVDNINITILVQGMSEHSTCIDQDIISGWQKCDPSTELQLQYFSVEYINQQDIINYNQCLAFKILFS